MEIQPLNRYTTIKEPDKIYDTGTNPILISVSEAHLSSYVVKHNNGHQPCAKLSNELLAYYFLRLWNINTPEAAIIDVRHQHIKDIISTSHQPRFFQTPCWGTLFYSESIEFLRFFENMSVYERGKFTNPNQLLKIILFDLWVSNDDRTSNNPNLLIVPSERGFDFWPIDHEAIFNGNTLHRGLYELNFSDTLLYHPAVKSLLGLNLKNTHLLEMLICDVYDCIAHCQKNIAVILSFLPKEWGIDLNKLHTDLHNNIFAEKWITSLKNTFLTLVQEAVQR